MTTRKTIKKLANSVLIALMGVVMTYFWAKISTVITFGSQDLNMVLETKIISRATLSILMMTSQLMVALLATSCFMLGAIGIYSNSKKLMQ